MMKLKDGIADLQIGQKGKKPQLRTYPLSHTDTPRPRESASRPGKPRYCRLAISSEIFSQTERYIQQAAGRDRAMVSRERYL